jgi:hypothetical protein
MHLESFNKPHDEPWRGSYLMKSISFIFIVLGAMISGCGSSDVVSSDNDTEVGFDRVVLSELFIAVTCTKCPFAEAALNQLFEEESATRIVTIHWHPWLYVGDSDAIEFGVDRFRGFTERFGGQAGLPTCYVNGIRRILGAPSVEDAYNSYSDAYSRECVLRSDLSISIAPVTDSSQVSSRINIVSVADTEIVDVEMISVLVENEAENTNAPLGPDNWSYLPRIATSQTISIGANNNASYDVIFPLGETWVRDNLYLVVFVQEANYGEVLQASMVPLSTDKQN